MENNYLHMKKSNFESVKWRLGSSSVKDKHSDNERNKTCYLHCYNKTETGDCGKKMYALST
jgi:hypothetical protein